ncbi:hypothetical protein AAEX28_11845 [Lentisphaerota bacterium WC36G]|nr:hypothetical protein LJT99_14680 [Lentisphaerae bacterium WC36]
MKGKLIKIFEILAVVLIILVLLLYGAFEVWIRNYADASNLYKKARVYKGRHGDKIYKLLMNLSGRAGSQNAYRALGEYYLFEKKDAQTALGYYLKAVKTDTFNSYRVFRCYQDIKKEKEGIKWLKEQTTKGNDYAYLVLGNYYFDKAKFKIAKDYYKKGTKAQEFFSWLGVYRCSFGQKDYQEARLAANKIISIEPKNTAGYTFLGEICQAEKKYDEAIKYYIKVIELGGETVGRIVDMFFLQGKLSEAEETVLKLQKKYKINVDLALAKLYFRQNKFKKGFEIIDFSQKLNSYECYILGRMLKEKNKYQEALKCFFKARQKGMDTFSEIPETYMALGQYDEAILELKKMIEEDKANKSNNLQYNFYCLSRAYYGCKKYDLALNSAQKAYKMGHLYSSNVMFNCYLNLKMYDKAEQLIVEMKKKKYPHFGGDIIMIYEEQNKIDEAVKYINSRSDLNESQKAQKIAKLNNRQKNKDNIKK